MSRFALTLLVVVTIFSGGAAMAGSHSASDNNIATSDETFQEAVKAAKAKDFAHAYTLFEMQAQAAQHDAQFNLALLLKSGRGTPQHYPDALMWSWLSYLGGIEKSRALAEEIIEYLPPETIAEIREKVATRLRKRIDDGDKNAVTQFAKYHLEIVEDADYQQAYFWYSIASAIGIEGSQEARDSAAENLEMEQIIATQEEARSTFYGLSFGK